MKIAVEAHPPARAGHIQIQFLTKEDRERIAVPATEAEFSGKPNQLVYQREPGVLYVGLGEKKKVDAAVFRRAAGAAVMYLKRVGQLRHSFALENWPDFTGAVVEGAMLADYRFERFKETKSPTVESLHLQVNRSHFSEARATALRGHIIAEATNFCREIGNLPGNLLHPLELAAQAQRMARRRGLKAMVYDEDALAARGFGGLLAVGAGSQNPPRLIVLDHRGGTKGDPPLVLVGKAITFDSGGISIKQAANMEEMIFDKCGGVAVLGAMAAIAELKLKRNVIGILASAENLPSATAYRPGDILTAYDGTHIEVLNTDAEGRIVLADAIAYAREDLRASAIIDLATLTGACGVALGDSAAGFWNNDAAFGLAVQAASERAGERIWSMPSYTDYEEQIRSDVAHLKNTGGRLGGACTAAAFLKAFARQTPWAHLDIAFMAHREKDQAWQARGATGYGVRLLVELAEAWGAD